MIAHGIGWPVKIHRPQIANKNHKKVEKSATSNPQQFIPEDYKKVARGLEQQFAQYMLEQMQKTTGSKDDSTAMNYYKELSQKQQAKTMTEVKNGLGIQDLILDEIYPKKFRNPEALAAFNAHKDKGVFKRNNIEMAGPPEAKAISLKKELIKTGNQEANHE